MELVVKQENVPSINVKNSAPARLVSETKSSNQVQVPSWPGEGNIISRLTNTSINRQRKSMDLRVLQNRGKVGTNIRHTSCSVKNSVSLPERLQHRMASPCPHLPPTSLLGEGASPSSLTWQSFGPPAPRAQLKAVSWLHNAHQNPSPHTLGSGSFGDNPLKSFWDLCVTQEGKVLTEGPQRFLLTSFFPQQWRDMEPRNGQQVTRASRAGTVLFPAIEDVDRICGSYREWWQKGTLSKEYLLPVPECRSAVRGVGMGSVTLFYFSFFLFS